MSKSNIIDLIERPKAKPVKGSRAMTYKGDGHIFKLSFSGLKKYWACPHCYWLEMVEGIKPGPGTPIPSINSHIDRIYKNEYDGYRERQQPTPLFIQEKLPHLVPAKIAEIDQFRNALHYGLQTPFKQNPNIILGGGLDDLLFNQREKSFHVLDYKAQADNTSTRENYMEDNRWHQLNKLQLEFYSYILMQKNYNVGPTAYLEVCNFSNESQLLVDELFTADHNIEKSVAAKLIGAKPFLVPVTITTAWVEEEINKLIKTLDCPEPPAPSDSCEMCAIMEIRQKYHRPSNKQLQLIV